MTQRSNPLILAVSDATGETAAQCCRAALAQFGHFPEVSIRVMPHVLNERTLEHAVKEAQQTGALIIYTLVGPELRSRIKTMADEHGVTAFDLLGGLIAQVGRQLGKSPLSVPGLGHELTQEYFRRIEAVEFAVTNDDGKQPSNLPRADIVIVGISRTSKTPLSNYIAHRGYRVANLPIVLDVPLPPDIEMVDPKRVFALEIDAMTLMNIRQARMESLRMGPDSGYGDLRHIRREIAWSRRIYEAHPQWTLIDVTKRAIEETASMILEAYRSQFESGAGAIPSSRPRVRAHVRPSPPPV